MSSTTRKALSVLGVTASIVAGISLGGGTAMAKPPECKAAPQPGWGCLAVVNDTKDPKIRSLRIGVRGSCIPDLAKRERYATYYAIPGASVTPRPSGWIFYPGSNCDGGRSEGVNLGGWSGVDKDRYVTVTVINN